MNEDGRKWLWNGKQLLKVAKHKRKRSLGLIIHSLSGCFLSYIGILLKFI